MKGDGCGEFGNECIATKIGKLYVGMQSKG